MVTTTKHIKIIAFANLALPQYGAKESITFTNIPIIDFDKEKYEEFLWVTPTISTCGMRKYWSNETRAIVLCKTHQNGFSNVAVSTGKKKTNAPFGEFHTVELAKTDMVCSLEPYYDINSKPYNFKTTKQEKSDGCFSNLHHKEWKD